MICLFSRFDADIFVGFQKLDMQKDSSKDKSEFRIGNITNLKCTTVTKNPMAKKHDLPIFPF